MGKFKPIFESLSEAAVRGARHADVKLPQLAKNHADQLDDFVRRTRKQDKFTDKPDTPQRRTRTDLGNGPNRKTTIWDRDTGRPISETGTIKKDFGSSTRRDNATEIGRLGDKGDHGGHLGAHRFFGDTPDEGIAPQAGNLNIGAWKTMENEWAAWVNRGYQVDYSIDVFPPGAVRPDSFSVKYSVTNPTTGEVVYRNRPEFDNVAGAVFDRVKTADMPRL